MTKPTYEEVVEALGKAIDTYQYASMTSWERECYKEEMAFAEKILEAACAKPS